MTEPQLRAALAAAAAAVARAAALTRDHFTLVPGPAGGGR